MTLLEAWDILTQIAYKANNDEYAANCGMMLEYKQAERIIFELVEKMSEGDSE